MFPVSMTERRNLHARPRAAGRARRSVVRVGGGVVVGVGPIVAGGLLLGLLGAVRALLGHVAQSLQVLLVVLAGDEPLLDVSFHRPPVEKSCTLGVRIATHGG